MRISLNIEDGIRERLRALQSEALPELRQQAVEETMRETLVDIIRLNPVDTARSRAAWVNALEQLGGIAPAGWQGPHPTEEHTGRSLGQATQQDDRDQTAVAAVNAVDYVPLLEYGSRRTAPVGMVRRALQAARQRLIDRLRAALARV